MFVQKMSAEDKNEIRMLTSNKGHGSESISILYDRKSDRIYDHQWDAHQV